LTAGFLLLGMCVWTGRPHAGYAPTAEASPLPGIPRNATEVHWNLRGMGGPASYYRFKTTEDAFHRWAAGFDVTGPIEAPTRVLYYDHTLKDFGSVHVADAVSYLWEFEDQGEYLTYDRTTGIAYYHEHSR